MTIIVYLIQTSLCMGIFYVFYHLFLKRETTFHINRIYLISTVLISLLFPLIQFPLAIIEITIPDRVALLTAGDGRQFKSGESMQDQSFNWISVFQVIYLTGVMFYLYRFAKEILNLRRIRKLGSQDLLHGFNCIFSSKVKTPFSFFKNIYLPAPRHVDETEMERIIRHESIHIVEKHSLDNIFLEIIKIVLWINPFIHFYQRRMKELHEFIADAEVVRNEGWFGYCNFLIRHLHPEVTTITSQLAQTPLKSRFIMMTRSPSTSLAKWKYAGIIPLVIFSFLIFSCSDSNPSLSSPNLSHESSPPMEITITEDLDYIVNYKKYAIDEVEKLIIAYVAETKDPCVNVRMANPSLLNVLTVGDIGELFDIAFDLHIKMELYTNN